MRTLTRAAVAALLTVVIALLAGCAGLPSIPDLTVPDEPPAIAPVAVQFERLGIMSTLIPLGLNPDGTVGIPSLDEPMQASWYSNGPAPGQVGAAVLLGHVDARGKPAIFHELPKAKAGDTITVDRADGSVLRFVVTRVQQVAKAEFPTAQVYGPTDTPEIRLITCGGAFDRKTRHYEDNVIVYATLA